MISLSCIQADDPNFIWYGKNSAYSIIVTWCRELERFGNTIKFSIRDTHSPNEIIIFLYVPDAFLRLRQCCYSRVLHIFISIHFYSGVFHYNIVFLWSVLRIIEAGWFFVPYINRDFLSHDRAFCTFFKKIIPIFLQFCDQTFVYIRYYSTIQFDMFVRFLVMFFII